MAAPARFSLHCSARYPDRDSFPTRRSSDLPSAQGTLKLSGVDVAQNQAVSVGTSLANVVYTGAQTAGTDIVYARATDGTRFGARTHHTTTLPSTLGPLVPAENEQPTGLERQ